MLLRLISTAMLILCLAVVAHANELYTFDKEHTAIQFSVSNIFGLSEITGSFTDYDGYFYFCTQHPEKDKIVITLYSSGIHTSDGAHEKELKGADFFNAAGYPKIYFTSTRVVFIDKNNADVEGRLSLLGVTKPVTLYVHYLHSDHDTDGDDYIVDFTATGIIRRADFGMDYLDPLVGNNVRLSIKAKGIEKEKSD